MSNGRRSWGWMTGMLVMAWLGAGCASRPVFVTPESRTPIDRKLVEYPSGFVLKTVARGITAGSAIAFVKDPGEYQGALIVAENGENNKNPRIYGWKPDGTYFNIYPKARRFPFVNLISSGNQIEGPIGGMVITQGRIFVTHRYSNGRGIVSSIGFDGSINTVVADLPAEGDYGMTDITVDPLSGKLYFGVGAATNSGVVGVDNWNWVTQHPDFCDLPANNIKLLGYKFFTRNPNAGFFGGDDNVGTAPYHPFGKSSQLSIPKAPNDKSTSTIYRISPAGGDLTVYAWGLRYPRGVACDEYGNLFATNEGMELRGTRPVKEDPDVLLKITPDTWYGWPDFSADLMPISDPKYREDSLVSRSGYPELASLVDHETSHLVTPRRDTLVVAPFQWLSGAAKFDFVPGNGPFHNFRGSVIIALNGDRAPLATSGYPIRGTPGRKLVRVDLASKAVEDFIHNTEGVPASKLGSNVEALERPIDAKFGPDGNLYIMDMGAMEIRDGRERYTSGAGRIFVLEPIPQP